MSQLPDTSVLSLPQPSLRAFSSMSSSNSDLSLSLFIASKVPILPCLPLLPGKFPKLIELAQPSPGAAPCSSHRSTHRRTQKPRLIGHRCILAHTDTRSPGFPAPSDTSTQTLLGEPPGTQTVLVRTFMILEAFALSGFYLIICKMGTD